ncbi:MAG: hypothetical protein DI585_03140 [Pseudomonas fluorescens]|nr:MAG: hypothetical protein DI585_03140 [Pseudomonas fluorescens]
MTHTCAWPNCPNEGSFPAPRNPRDLRERQYFCQDHIKEFNKRWNGLDGFSEQEIYGMQDGTAQWNRPTWNMGLNGAGPNAGRVEHPFADPFVDADDLFGFFKQRVAREREGESLPSTRHLPADVKESCAIFGIEQPLEAAMLKKRYLNLMKQHHPDVNKSDNAADQTKRINVAYRILTDYAERHGINPL